MLFSLVGPGYHYEQYFDTTGVTLKETNGEFTETCHLTLKKDEATHGLQSVRKIGTPIHEYKVLTIHNSTKFGGNLGVKFVKNHQDHQHHHHCTYHHQQELLQKKLPFDKNFLHRYPAAVAAHNSNKYK